MIETYIVPEGINRSRADKALAAAFPQHSRVAWQRAIDAGLVRRGETALQRRDEVLAGEVLTFEEPEVIPMDLTPANIPLDIVLED